MFFRNYVFCQGVTSLNNAGKVSIFRNWEGWIVDTGHPGQGQIGSLYKGTIGSFRLDCSLISLPSQFCVSIKVCFYCMVRFWFKSSFYLLCIVFVGGWFHAYLAPIFFSGISHGSTSVRRGAPIFRTVSGAVRFVAAKKMGSNVAFWRKISKKNYNFQQIR